MDYSQLHNQDEQNLVHMAEQYFGSHIEAKDCASGSYWALSGSNTPWYVNTDINGQRILFDPGGAPLVNLTSMTFLCYISGSVPPSYISGAPMPHHVAPQPQSAHEVLMSNGYDTVETKLNHLENDRMSLETRMDGELQMIKDNHMMQMATKDQDIDYLKNVINNLVNPDKSLSFVTEKKFSI